MSIPHPPSDLSIEGLKQFIEEHNLTPVNFHGRTRTLPLIRADIIFNVDTLNRKNRRLQIRSSPSSPSRNRLPSIRVDTAAPSPLGSDNTSAATPSPSALRSQQASVQSEAAMRHSKPMAAAVTSWMDTTTPCEPTKQQSPSRPSEQTEQTAQMAVEEKLRQELVAKQQYIDCIRDPLLMERIQAVLDSEELQEQQVQSENQLTSQRLAFAMKEKVYQEQISKLQMQLECLRNEHADGAPTTEVPVHHKETGDAKTTGQTYADWHAMTLVAVVVAILAALLTMQTQLSLTS